MLTKLRNNQLGAAYIVAILMFIIVFSIGIVSWRIWNNKDSASIKHSNKLTQLKDRKYSLYLDGATDDNLINYYKIGLKITLENDNEIIDDMGAGPEARPCPQIEETYGLEKTIKENTMYLKIVNYQRVENKEYLSINDPECKKIDVSGNLDKVFSLDKNWLTKSEFKKIQIVGLNNKEFSLSTSGYKLILKDGTKTTSQIPFYPDKVAVMIAWGDDCPASSKENIVLYTKRQNIPLADEKYPGLEAIYRRPKREVNVILDSHKDTEGGKYSTDLGGDDCSILTSKPNLKSLDQVGLPYQ